MAALRHVAGIFKKLDAVGDNQTGGVGPVERSMELVGENSHSIMYDSIPDFPIL